MEDGIMDTRVTWQPMPKMEKDLRRWTVLGATTMVPINGMVQPLEVSLAMAIVPVVR